MGKFMNENCKSLLFYLICGKSWSWFEPAYDQKHSGEKQDKDNSSYSFCSKEYLFISLNTLNIITTIT